MNEEALIGRTIAGKFVIETLVGQGAMGAVYRARQTTLETTLALKILHRPLAGDPMFAARFLREAQAASRVDHPSSMRVIDFGEEPDGLLYIAMEYVDGRTLAQIIDEESPLPVARIVDIASQTLAALAVAHDIGVIHRDLKPENIMVLEGLDDEGRIHDAVKVCDFGVAKLLEGGARAPSVTAQGVVVGTPHYMSPEQACGDTLDPRSDIYAMGVLLFHMMTGKVPFDSSTAFGTAFMHVNDEPTRPRVLNPKVDGRLERICLKAMRKKREERHASARELRAELRALVGEDVAFAGDARGASGTGGLLQQIEARPRRSGLVASVVVLGASIALGTFLYQRPPAEVGKNVQNASNPTAIEPGSGAGTPGAGAAGAIAAGAAGGAGAGAMTPPRGGLTTGPSQVGADPSAGVDNANGKTSDPAAARAAADVEERSPLRARAQRPRATKTNARRAGAKPRLGPTIAIGEEAPASSDAQRAASDAKGTTTAMPPLPPPDDASKPSSEGGAGVEGGAKPKAGRASDAAASKTPSKAAPPTLDPKDLPLPVFSDPPPDPPAPRAREDKAVDPNPAPPSTPSPAPNSPPLPAPSAGTPSELPR